jgi:hypothetical protein
MKDSLRLLSGPYSTPALRVGERAVCHYRKCVVVVTSWTDAPISWPRGRPMPLPCPSLLVDDELLRAIKSESAAAIRQWWGVSQGLIARWRKAFEVARMDNPGSARLIRAALEKSTAASREKVWTEAERQHQIRRALAGRSALWTDEELALLGTLPDGDLAAHLGRTVEALRLRRARQGIPTARDRRHKGK